MRARIAIVAVAAAALLTLVGCSSGAGAANAPANTTPASSSSTPTATPTKAADHTAVYEVTSDAATANNITYFTLTNGNSGQEQAQGAPLPWTKTITLASGFLSYNSMSLVAQATGDATTISCKITIDGVVKAEQTSTGAYSVVTCAATK
jgi:hypothetical protein